MTPEQEQFIEQLYYSHFTILTLYASSKLSDSNQVQDVVQDTFHEAILKIEKLMDHPNPEGWLMNTVKNKIRESERSRRRYIKRFLSLDTDFWGEPPQNEDGTVNSEPNDALPGLREIEQILNPEELNLLMRFTNDRVTHLQIAKELGLTVWASQKRLQRIRQKLRKKLLKDEEKN